MGLNNSQYDRIMRLYSTSQNQAAHDLEVRRRKAYEAIPELQDLDGEVAGMARAAARAILEGGQSGDSFRLKTEQITLRRSALLTEHGLPADYLSLRYTCPDCKDTGYIGSTQCHCFRQHAIDLLYTQSGIQEALKVDCFANFKMDYYPEDLVSPKTGLSSQETMIRIMKNVKAFIQDFDNSFENLFFYGGTGLGKTFLSHCIAGQLLDTAHSVIYYSAYDLFDQLANEKFGKSKDSNDRQQDLDYIQSCDLLIIDDLGTELTNAFVASQLFVILNERFARRKSTIISTNLSLGDFSNTYSERIMSRITSSYKLLEFFGNDIRMQKKLSGR